MSKIKTLSSYIKDKVLKHRFFYLFLSAILGILSAKYLYQPICDCITNHTCKLPINPLFLVLLALPTTTLLWYFRTHDTRENIHQNDLNIHQNDFFDALKMLTDDKVVRREIATQRLINLTKKVPEYKEDVKFAFIKVLKSFPRKKLSNNNWESEKRTYAQHILKWFNNNNYTAKKLDLNDCIFELQEFTIEERKSDLFKLFTERQFKNISFDAVDLREVNLENADLRGVNLDNANLENANLRDTDVTGVEFTGANLKNTDFEGAKH